MKPKKKINHTHKVSKSKLIVEEKNKRKKQRLLSKSMKEYKIRLYERMFGEFNVLGNKVYITEDCKTMLRIGHNFRILECNERFPLLDKKIQEFMVTMMLDVYENQNKLKSNYNKVYFNADKKALVYALKKYPKTPKVFWLFALQLIFEENLSQMNLLRIENVLSSIKSKKDNGIKKYVGEYKRKVKEQIDWNKCTDKALALVSRPLSRKLTKQEMQNGNIKKMMDGKLSSKTVQKKIMRTPLSKFKGEKNITMRGNKNEDMSKRLLTKHPKYKIIDKGRVCNNFGMGGNKYYQHFWVRVFKIL